MEFRIGRHVLTRKPPPSTVALSLDSPFFTPMEWVETETRLALFLAGWPAPVVEAILWLDRRLPYYWRRVR